MVDEVSIDSEQISREVEDRVKAEIGAYPDSSNNNGQVPSRYVTACLDSNELGDGLLYVAINKDKFIYNVTAKEWMAWGGQYWEYDDHNQAFAAVENVIDRLLEETKDLAEKINDAVKTDDKDLRKKLESQRDKIYKRIEKLRTDRGRNPVLKFAISCRDPLTVSANRLDQHPWLLACKNGVIDLRSGKFKDGQPDDFITIVSPTEWKGFDEKCTRWERFLLEIMNVDEEMVAYLNRLLGYAITGTTREHIMPVFWGKGRNGKGTLVKVLQYVMGPLAGTIQTELLLYNRLQRSSAGPSPDIVDLKGLRMAFASETEENSKFSASKVKWLTGGDQLVGRNLNEKKQIRFEPSHTVFLMTNNKPIVSGDDYAFWKRIHLIPFKLSYVIDKAEDEMEEFERIADPDLEIELKEEASGILAWLVKGCFEYRKHGIRPPQTVKNATLEYQQDEDLLGQFVDYFCVLKSGVKTQSSEIFDPFLKWFKKNVSSKGISQKKFGTMMKKRFDSTKIKGVVHYLGIELDLFKTKELEGED